MLLNAAGFLNEPIISDPSAIGIKLAAIAEAAPPLDPPADSFLLYGLRVGPKTELNVCEPTPNSGVLVFPINMAPDDRILLASFPSCFGMLFSNILDP